MKTFRTRLLHWLLLTILIRCIFAADIVNASPAVLQETMAINSWLEASTPNLAPNASPVQWKFAHPAPPVSLLPPVWQRGFDWLNRRSGNTIDIKMFGGGTLYGTNGGFKAIRAGIADSGTCYSVAESKGFELTKTFHLPFVAPSNPYLTARIINELTASTLKSEFNRRGVYPGHIIPSRPLSLMSKQPVRTPADLRGKKVISFMLLPGIAEQLGYTEIRVPFPEIYTALQQGLADAVIWVEMGFIPYKIYEQASYFTHLNLAPGTIETCINRRSFDRLATELKPLVHDFQQKVSIAMVDRFEQFAKEAEHVLIQQNVQIIHLSDNERAQWQLALVPAVDSYLDDCEAAGKDCRALVKDIQKLAKQYAHLSNAELVKLTLEKPVKGIIEF